MLTRLLKNRAGILFFLTALCCLILSGCEDSKKKEAEIFHSTYYVNGYREADKSLEKLIKTLPPEKRASGDAVYSRVESSAILSAYTELLGRVRSAEIKDKEVQPLKEELTRLVNSRIFLLKEREAYDSKGADAREMLSRLEIGYLSKYASLAKGPPSALMYISGSGTFYGERIAGSAYGVISVKTRPVNDKITTVIARIAVSNNTQETATYKADFFKFVDAKDRIFPADPDIAQPVTLKPQEGDVILCGFAVPSEALSSPRLMIAPDKNTHIMIPFESTQIAFWYPWDEDGETARIMRRGKIITE